MRRRLYCDHNATSPLTPEVKAALREVLAEPQANPSSQHAAGQRAADLLERSRRQVAAAVGAAPEQVVFTSGGSEANALALGGVLAATRRPRLAVGAVEHPSVLLAATELCRRAGRELLVLPATRAGGLDLDAAAHLLDARVSLVSCMAANHETGALQPLAELLPLLRQHGCLLHVDAAQALGRIPLDVAALGADLISLSGHKLGAPAGIGALVVRGGTPLLPLTFRGHHERGLRPGTPNLLGAVGMGTACQVAVPRALAEAERLRHQRELLAQRIHDLVPDTELVTPLGAASLCQTLCVAFAGAHAAAVVAELDALGVQASAGAACRAGDSEPSSVLLAMGLRPELALCAVRYSLGLEHTGADIERVAQATERAVAAVRAHVGLGDRA
jgi:cysteine desulfurase